MKGKKLDESLDFVQNISFHRPRIEYFASFFRKGKLFSVGIEGCNEGKDKGNEREKKVCFSSRGRLINKASHQPLANASGLLRLAGRRMRSFHRRNG